MSADPRDYSASSRSDERGLPPLREMVGDVLDRSPVSPYSFDFQDVHRALPGSPKPYGRYSSFGGYYPQRGPTLPPIRNFPPSRSHSSGYHARSASADTLHDDTRRGPAEPSGGHPYSTPSNPKPSAGPPGLPYSYNVLRAQQGDLVDVRTPSARAQGILRPTAIIDDEDDSHKRYKCNWPGCDKKYDRPSSLEVHRNTHTGSQPYPCPHPGCPRAFNVKSNMLRHFRSHPKSTTPQASMDKDEQDSDSDGEDEKANWPEESGGRYFHTASSASNMQASSSSATQIVPKKSSGSSTSSSNKYYSSSRHR